MESETLKNMIVENRNTMEFFGKVLLQNGVTYQEQEDVISYFLLPNFTPLRYSDVPKWVFELIKSHQTFMVTAWSYCKKLVKETPGKLGAELSFLYYPSPKVQIYRNLSKKTFSVKHRGYVLDYCDSFCLKFAHFVVNESGRQRVIKNKRKNVHAWVEGLYLRQHPEGKEEIKEVCYNPYKNSSFLRGESPIVESEFVWGEYPKIYC